MLRPLLLSSAIALALVACGDRTAPESTMPATETATAAPAENALMTASTLPFQAPPFDRLKDADYQPAIEEGMKQHLAEIRAIEFVSRLLAEGKLDRTRYKDVLLHRVDGGAALAQFGATSKARADPAFLRRLFTLGRGAGQDWLAEHFNDIGVCSSVEKVPHTRA